MPRPFEAGFEAFVATLRAKGFLAGFGDCMLGAATIEETDFPATLPLLGGKGGPEPGFGF